LSWCQIALGFSELIIEHFNRFFLSVFKQPSEVGLRILGLIACEAFVTSGGYTDVRRLSGNVRFSQILFLGSSGLV